MSEEVKELQREGKGPCRKLILSDDVAGTYTPMMERERDSDCRLTHRRLCAEWVTVTVGKRPEKVSMAIPPGRVEVADIVQEDAPRPLASKEGLAVSLVSTSTRTSGLC